MIAAWMLYSIALGALVVVGATAVEQTVRTMGGPTRRVWATALVAAFLLPVLGVLLKDSAAAVEVQGAVVAASPTAGVVMDGVDALARLDRVLVSGWAVLTTLLASTLVGGLVATSLEARRWRPVELDGVPVRVSPDVGPALVGFRAPTIVVPEWALELDPAQRAMLLRHEQEHLRAGDPRLLLLLAALVAAEPWNPALWYIAARARLAIEVDCDRRVLGHREADLRDYAELLISVGARRSRFACGVGFSVGRPFLERRIDRMTEAPNRSSRLHALLVAAGLVGLLAAAWALPQPVRAAKISNQLPIYCPDDGTKELGLEILTAFERST